MAFTFRSIPDRWPPRSLRGRVHDEEDRTARPVGALRAGHLAGDRGQPGHARPGRREQVHHRRDGPERQRAAAAATCRSAPTSPSTASSPTSACCRRRTSPPAATARRPSSTRRPLRWTTRTATRMVTIKVTPQSGDARGDLARTVQHPPRAAGRCLRRPGAGARLHRQPSAAQGARVGDLRRIRPPARRRRWSATRGTSATAASARAGRPRTSTATADTYPRDADGHRHGRLQGLALEDGRRRHLGRPGGQLRLLAERPRDRRRDRLQRVAVDRRVAAHHRQLRLAVRHRSAPARA